MTLLCLDFGNTRVKWGLREGDAWRAQDVGMLGDLDRIDVAVERIVACNVAGASARAAGEALARRLGAPLRWVTAAASGGGVRSAYARPEQLGADRWAALVGARALRDGASLVVVSGTATTIDVLDEDGCFRGGLIVPGLDLMRAALASGTADLPPEAGEFRESPDNTLDAIASGAVQATLGAIERMYRQVAARRDPLCLLSGGAAGRLEPHLAPTARRVDNLVLEGLARLAREAPPA